MIVQQQIVLICAPATLTEYRRSNDTANARMKSGSRQTTELPRQNHSASFAPSQSRHQLDIGLVHRDAPWRALSQSVSKETILELEQRATSGMYVYLLCWLGISFSTGLMLMYTMPVILITLVWFILAAARFFLHRSFAKLVNHNEYLARAMFLGLLFASGVWLSITTSITFYWPELHAASVPMIILSSVLCASATFTLAIDRAIRIGMPLSILLPAAIGQLLNITTANLTFILLIAIFLVYLLMASKVIHRDYWNAVEARALLQQRAEEFEKLSITDVVTKIPNRRYFERRFIDEWSRAFRHDEMLSVMLIDIDHFKRINDTYGHPFGDRCLAEVAVALQRNVYRDVDIVARYGGEEFVVVLPDTPSQDAYLVGERLRQGVASLEISVEGVMIQLTCSIGLISVAPTTTRISADIAIMLADQALYAAKSAGRNCTVPALVP